MSLKNHFNRTSSSTLEKMRRPWLLWYANQAFAWLERLARHKTAMCLLVMSSTMGIRIALLPWLPIPQPYVADEFSYLLGAETFTSGRLTNPTHPMWMHFETFHQLMRPTYMSMYPPGQMLFLALGQALLGHPWFGVWISFGLFSACLCWMLQNWVPPVYAVLGTAITLANISILGYWMNSYWGGAVAASAGCLLLGTLPRLAQRVRSKDVVLAAIGIVLLANTRPYEGMVMSAAAGVALLFLRWRQKRSLLELLSRRCVIPLLLVLAAGAVLDGYYNYRVTGNALQMPYSVFFREYRSAPVWIMLPESKPPVYRHSVLANSWQWELEHFRKIRSSPSLLLDETLTSFRFYCWELLLLPIALGILLSGSYRLWAAAGICFFVWAGLLIESNHFPHYIAGGAGLFPLLAMYGFRWLRVIGRRRGPVLVLALATVLVMQGVVRRGDEHRHPWETRPSNFMSPRMIAAREATKQGGRHLILVRHSADYMDKSDECVYNSANIDASDIVWAHDMGDAKNRELLDYYRGSRKVWLYQPDSDARTLVRYELTAQ